MALLIRRAAHLLRDAERIARDVDPLVEGKRIAAIGPNLPLPPAAQTVDATGCAVIPVLIDAHAHLYQNLLKGIGAGLELVPWCDAILFPTVGAIQHEQRAGNGRPACLWSALAPPVGRIWTCRWTSCSRPGRTPACGLWSDYPDRRGLAREKPGPLGLKGGGLAVLVGKSEQ